MEYPIELPNTAISIQSLPQILTTVFPSWSKENISVKPVSGGITNMLIKCTHTNDNKKDVVLVRSYGNNTNLIIDRTNEFNNHLLLHKLQLAPSIYAKLSNGIIYGYLSGRSLAPEELSNDQLFPLISQKLGYWHTTISKHDPSIKNGGHNDLWDTISSWIDIAPAVDQLEKLVVNNCSAKSISPSSSICSPKNVKQLLHAELQWLRGTIDNKSRLVKAHCDLLSGNIVIPPQLDRSFTTKNSQHISPTNKKFNLDLPKPQENPICFIDYEYMLCAPRGFDIANHLAEWQGFECEKSRIPKPSKDNEVLRKWCYAYILGATMTGDGPISVNLDLDREVDKLIEEIYLFYGVPGFYWGIWAAIQSKISTIDFDYGSYCVNRLEEYFTWKQGYLATR